MRTLWVTLGGGGGRSTAVSAARDGSETRSAADDGGRMDRAAAATSRRKGRRSNAAAVRRGRRPETSSSLGGYRSSDVAADFPFVVAVAVVVRAEDGEDDLPGGTIAIPTGAAPSSPSRRTLLSLTNRNEWPRGAKAAEPGSSSSKTVERLFMVGGWRSIRPCLIVVSKSEFPSLVSGCDFLHFPLGRKNSLRL